MPDELRIELLPEGWRLEHTEDPVLPAKQDGVSAPGALGVTMTSGRDAGSCTALIVSGEIRA